MPGYAPQLWAHGIPVMAVDGAHAKTNLGGIWCIAGTIAPTGAYVELAVGFVARAAEHGQDWRWFFEQMHSEGISLHSHAAIITDMGSGLTAAAREFEASGMGHWYGCSFHMADRALLRSTKDAKLDGGMLYRHNDRLPLSPTDLKKQIAHICSSTFTVPEFSARIDDLRQMLYKRSLAAMSVPEHDVLVSEALPEGSTDQAPPSDDHNATDRERQQHEQKRKKVRKLVGRVIGYVCNQAKEQRCALAWRSMTDPPTYGHTTSNMVEALNSTTREFRANHLDKAMSEIVLGCYRHFLRVKDAVLHGMSTAQTAAAAAQRTWMPHLEIVHGKWRQQLEAQEALFNKSTCIHIGTPGWPRPGYTCTLDPACQQEWTRLQDECRLAAADVRVGGQRRREVADQRTHAWISQRAVWSIVVPNPPSDSDDRSVPLARTVALHNMPRCSCAMLERVGVPCVHLLALQNSYPEYVNVRALLPECLTYQSASVAVAADVDRGIFQHNHYQVGNLQPHAVAKRRTTGRAGRQPKRGRSIEQRRIGRNEAIDRSMGSGRRKCSACGETTHTVKSCSQRPAILE